MPPPRGSVHHPSKIDKIPYDAPLTFPLPTKEWTESHGGRRNNRTEKLTSKDVPPIDLRGKWILISGANNGIGKEAAFTFAAWGANLVLACREPRASEGHPLKAVEGCIAAARNNGHADSVVEWWRYDATDLASVDALARRWLDTGRVLDVLCNNAGVGASPSLDSSKPWLTGDGFEFVHQVSFESVQTDQHFSGILRTHEIHETRC